MKSPSPVRPEDRKDNARHPADLDAPVAMSVRKAQPPLTLDAYGRGALYYLHYAWGSTAAASGAVLVWFGVLRTEKPGLSAVLVGLVYILLGAGGIYLGRRKARG
jgi:hypothetical protein